MVPTLAAALSIVCLVTPVSPHDPGQTAAQTIPTHTLARIAADAPAFLRPGASVPLRVLSRGTMVTVVDHQGEWLQIEFNDPQWGIRTAWINGRAATILEQTQSAVAPPPLPPASDKEHPPDNTPQPIVAVAPAAIPPSKPTAAPLADPTRNATGTGHAKLKNVKVRGYVTDVTSPTSFAIEDYRINSDQSVALDFENAGTDIKFALADVRVGVELEIAGVLDESTNELTARSVRVNLDQFRVKPLTAVISAPPKGLSQTDAGWTGDFVSDGQRIHVSPNTKISFRLSSGDKKAAKQKRDPSDATQADEPLHSLDQITAGMLLTYEGRRDLASGVITADRVTFMRNDLDSGEAKLWKSLNAQVKAAQGLAPGELKIARVGKFKLVPSDDVQAYVRRVGTSLIPQYQRDLPDSDPRKIPFQWYVVENKAANAFALANGTVVVNSGLFDVLDNEAQLAAVLGHEMAHATQEHTWRQMQFHKNERLGLAIAAALASAYGKYNLSDALTLTLGAIQSGYSRNLENQADRVGLEYMTDAGYDPREAPRVWKQMTKAYGDQGTNFFWSSHDNNATRRSYLMNELRNNYGGVNFTSLKLNEEEYRKIQGEVRTSSSTVTHVKVR